MPNSLSTPLFNAAETARLTPYPPALRKELIARLQGKDLATQLREVNREMNLHPYILDINNWGVEDYWETPFEFLKKNGDCEDFSITKYMLLKAAGYPVENMRVFAVRLRAG